MKKILCFLLAVTIVAVNSVGHSNKEGPPKIKTEFAQLASHDATRVNTDRIFSQLATYTPDVGTDVVNTVAMAQARELPVYEWNCGPLYIDPPDLAKKSKGPQRLIKPDKQNIRNQWEIPRLC